MQDRNIALLGFMGTGKSTVARLLAQRLGRRVVEMDAIIEQRAGKPISAIFAEDGEPYFRKIERRVVKKYAAKKGLIISCGGGVVLNPANIRDLEKGCQLFCLKAKPSVILKRVGTATHRPLLEGDSKTQKILKLLASRSKFYSALPLSIDTTTLTPHEVADQIVANVKRESTQRKRKKNARIRKRPAAATSATRPTS